MATYDYKCSNEHHREVVRSMTAAEELVTCTECGEEMMRVFSSPPVMFKAKGFYSSRG
jgi:putative FmdB family regulatory protein